MSLQFIGLLMVYTGLQLILGSVTFTVEGYGDNAGIITALLTTAKVLLHLALLLMSALGLYRAAQEET